MADLKANILIVEDEPRLRRFLRVTLESQNYKVIEASNGNEGLQQATLSRPDLIVLDIGLPDLDGVSLTQRVREWSSVPIIIVSANNKEKDKVAALDAGADDYLTKPFGVSELLARVRVGLRHAAIAQKETGEPVFAIGRLKVDLARREVSVGNQPVKLTPNEFRLLRALVRNAGRVMTHHQLLLEVWGPDAKETVHYLRVYMNQLRQKLETDPVQPKYLLTESGVGYRLAAEE